jgi:rubrerythrin
MSKLDSIDEVLDFAIAREEEAAKFYTELSESIQWPWMRQSFLDFAHEELKHKAKLIAVKSGKFIASSPQAIADLKIADFLLEIVPVSRMNYVQILTVAMQREKAAFRLYTDLAAATSDSTLRETFLLLAQEEAKHKLRFEVEYDNEVLKEN